jgi:hypothetical protein
MVLLLVAAALLACAGGARGFYLPGVAPADFRKVTPSFVFLLPLCFDFVFLLAGLVC